MTHEMQKDKKKFALHIVSTPNGQKGGCKTCQPLYLVALQQIKGYGVMDKMLLLWQYNY